MNSSASREWSGDYSVCCVHILHGASNRRRSGVAAQGSPATWKTLSDIRGLDSSLILGNQSPEMRFPWPAIPRRIDEYTEIGELVRSCRVTHNDLKLRPTANDHAQVYRTWYRIAADSRSLLVGYRLRLVKWEECQGNPDCICSLGVIISPPVPPGAFQPQQV
jgi:hypothetical protein